MLTVAVHGDVRVATCGVAGPRRWRLGLERVAAGSGVRLKVAVGDDHARWVHGADRDLIKEGRSQPTSDLVQVCKNKCHGRCCGLERNDVLDKGRVDVERAEEGATVNRHGYCENRCDWQAASFRRVRRVISTKCE